MARRNEILSCPRMSHLIRIILSSGPGEPQVWHVSGLGCCGDWSSLTRARLALQVVIDLASWLHHSPHLSASPSAMHTLQTLLLRLPCLVSQCFHNVSHLCHLCPQLGSFLSNDLACYPWSRQVYQGSDDGNCADARRPSVQLKRKHTTAQKAAKPIKTTKTINCPSNARYVECKVCYITLHHLGFTWATPQFNLCTLPKT